MGHHGELAITTLDFPARRAPQRRYRATVGAVEFELKGSGVAIPPEVQGREVTTVEGRALVGVVEGDQAFLVLDWRVDAGGGPASAQFWRTCADDQAALRGLLIISPGAERADGAVHCNSLAELADLLHQGYTRRAQITVT